MKATKVKWSECSDQEIHQLIEGANAELERRSAKQAAIARVKEMLSTQLEGTGLNIDDILAGTVAEKRKAVNKVAPKYRNPANADETWTGRGRKPLWVIDFLASGRSIEDTLIAE